MALIIPHGFGENPISVAPAANRPTIQLLKDPSDMVAPQIVSGLLQKVAMTSMPDVMAEQGSKAMDDFAGGFTPNNASESRTGWINCASLRAKAAQRRPRWREQWQPGC